MATLRSRSKRVAADGSEGGNDSSVPLVAPSSFLPPTASSSSSHHSAAARDSSASSVVDISSIPRPKKSLLIAYILWLVGGVFGVHHLYLGRDDHAFLYLTSFGGFGLAWIRDMWRLPHYVSQANYDYAYCEHVRLAYRLTPNRPPRSAPTMLGQMLFAIYFGELFSQLFNLLAPVPEPRFPTWRACQGDLSLFLREWTRFSVVLRLLSMVLRSVGVAFGSYFVGNISRLQYAPFRPVFLFTLLAQFLTYTATPAVNAISEFLQMASDAQATKEQKEAEDALANGDISVVSIIVSVCAAIAWRRWSREALEIVDSDPVRAAKKDNLNQNLFEGSFAAPESGRLILHDSSKKGLCKRFFRLSTYLYLFALFSGNYLLHLKVDDVPLKVSLYNLRNHPDTLQFIAGVKEQYNIIQNIGFAQWWNELKKQFDLGGVGPAYTTLGVDPNIGPSISNGELRRIRNKLALKFHPDKAAPAGSPEADLSPTERAAKFDEIQSAYERILKARKEGRDQAKPPAWAKKSRSTHTTHPPRSRDDDDIHEKKEREAADAKQREEAKREEARREKQKREEQKQKEEQKKREAKKRAEEAEKKRREQEEQNRRKASEAAAQQREAEQERLEREKAKQQQQQQDKSVNDKERRRVEKEKEKQERLQAEKERKDRDRRRRDAEAGLPTDNEPVHNTGERKELTKEQKLAQAKAAGSAAGQRLRAEYEKRTGKKMNVEDYPVPTNIRKAPNDKATTSKPSAQKQ